MSAATPAPRLKSSTRLSRCRPPPLPRLTPHVPGPGPRRGCTTTNVVHPQHGLSGAVARARVHAFTPSPHRHALAAPSSMPTRSNPLQSVPAPSLSHTPHRLLHAAFCTAVHSCLNFGTAVLRGRGRRSSDAARGLPLEVYIQQINVLTSTDAFRHRLQIADPGVSHSQPPGGDGVAVTSADAWSPVAARPRRPPVVARPCMDLPGALLRERATWLWGSEAWV